MLFKQPMETTFKNIAPLGLKLLFQLEQYAGIEPVSWAWEAYVLPLY